MMRKVVVILALVLGVGMTSALPMDYLVVEEGYPKVSPSGVARVGDPIAIDLMLRKKGVEPESARLNLSLEIDNPRVEITYDSEVKRFNGEKNIELSLPKGIRNVSVTLRGNAPSVSRLTTIVALSTSMYVYYDEDNKGYIKIPGGGVQLEVTDVEISQALSEINTAESKLSRAETLIREIEELGVDTTSLKVRLRSARDSLNIARKEHERGSVDLARSNAEDANALLEDTISEAEKKKEEAQRSSAYKKYLLIGAGVVIVIAIVVLVLRSRREELG